jgi:putative toxin-antitoxin system antitoxin component (TIGR02293 family)
MTHHGQMVFDKVSQILSVPGLASDRDLANLAERGLSVQKFERFKARARMTDAELHPFVLPRRTLAHRKAKRQPLTKEETDRALRVAYIVALAETVFGDQAKAMRWLRQPLSALGGRTPIDMIGTEAGARDIEERLYAIDEGVFA